MGADKANINRLWREQYQDHQPQVVALDVEDIALVAHAVHTVEGTLNVGKARPFGISSAVLACGFLV